MFARKYRENGGGFAMRPCRQNQCLITPFHHRRSFACGPPQGKRANRPEIPRGKSAARSFVRRPPSPYVTRDHRRKRVPFIGLLIIGAAAGFLATRVMRLNTDVPTTIAIGVFGALIGGLALRFL